MVPQHFPKIIPAGNYSGITPIGNNRYAVVDDKSASDGFAVIRLDIDSLTGHINQAAYEGFFSSGSPNRDGEGIAWCAQRGTLFISGEADNEVYEYRLDGSRTGNRLNRPDSFAKARRNRGLESLTYGHHRFYTTTEQPLPGDSCLRIQSFGDDLQPLTQYEYLPDGSKLKNGFHGVSDLCALPDGRLLVLEREIRVPRLKLGARTLIKIYETWPLRSDSTAGRHAQVLSKRLLCSFTSKLTLTSRRFANYEGMCMPYPNVLLLIADSQNRYRGVLRDWLLTIRLDSLQ